jgi:hypothetical protein
MPLVHTQLHYYLIPNILTPSNCELKSIPEFENVSSNELSKSMHLHLNANDMCNVANQAVLTHIHNSSKVCSNQCAVAVPL